MAWLCEPGTKSEDMRCSCDVHILEPYSQGGDGEKGEERKRGKRERKEKRRKEERGGRRRKEMDVEKRRREAEEKGD